MASIFTKIIRKEIPAYILRETELSIAFLDVFPLAKGHALVVPKREEDDFFDLTAEETADVMGLATKISEAQKKVFSCKKVGVSVIGLEGLHAHLHLIPIHEVSDMNFSKEKLSVSKEELLAMRHQLIEALDALGK